MADLLGIDTLFAEMVVGIGLALVLGNLFAWIKHRRGERPADVSGDFRPGRVMFLTGVGFLMSVWGIASLLTR